MTMYDGPAHYQVPATLDNASLSRPDAIMMIWIAYDMMQYEYEF